MTAAVRVHGDPPPAHGAAGDERLRGVDERLGRRDVDDPRGSAGSPDRSNVADERSGVGSCRPRARRVDAPGEQDHGRSAVGRAGRGGDEGTAVAEVLEVERDRACARRAPQARRGSRRRRGRLGCRATRTGRTRDRTPRRAARARGRDSRSARPVPPSPRATGSNRRRAPPRRRIRRGSSARAAPRRLHERAPRPRTSTRFPSSSCSPRPVVMPTIARAPTASASSTARSNPGAGTQITTSSGPSGSSVERPMRALAEDLTARSVHEEHRPPVSAAQSPARDHVPPLGLVGGRADDRDRPRREERAQVAGHASRRRAMIRRWMSDVPSSISSSFASRIHFSTGYSRE